MNINFLVLPFIFNINFSLKKGIFKNLKCLLNIYKSVHSPDRNYNQANDEGLAGLPSIDLSGCRLEDQQAQTLLYIKYALAVKYSVSMFSCSSVQHVHVFMFIETLCLHVQE